MKRRPIVIVLVVLAVAAGVLWLPRPPAAPTPPPIAPITPAEVRSIRMSGDEIPGAIATRLAPGEWIVTLRGSDIEWPASTGAVRSALRAAAEIAALPAEAPADFDPAATVTIADATGERTLAFAGAVIGGRRAVTIDGVATVSAPAALADLVIAGGPSAWRDRAAFPGFGADVDRLLIEQPASGDQPDLEIDLTRAGARWLLASPHLARADRKAVDAAIARVLGATIERFIDQPRDEALSGLSDPVFIITVEAGAESRRVRFGAQASASGLERFATTGEDGVLFVVDTTLLRELRLDPAAYTDRRPTPVLPADVASITVDFQDDTAAARAERTLDGWNVASGSFDPARLLAGLTSGAGVTVAFEPPAGWAPVASITLEDLAGGPLDVLTIGRDEAGDLRIASSLPGGEPVYFKPPDLTLRSLGLGSASE